MSTTISYCRIDGELLTLSPKGEPPQAAATLRQYFETSANKKYEVLAMPGRLSEDCYIHHVAIVNEQLPRFLNNEPLLPVLFENDEEIKRFNRSWKANFDPNETLQHKNSNQFDLSKKDKLSSAYEHVLDLIIKNSPFYPLNQAKDNWHNISTVYIAAINGSAGQHWVGGFNNSEFFTPARLIEHLDGYNLTKVNDWRITSDGSADYLTPNELVPRELAYSRDCNLHWRWRKLLVTPFSKPFALEVSKELKAQGYNNFSVTGYQCYLLSCPKLITETEPQRGIKMGAGWLNISRKGVTVTYLVSSETEPIKIEFPS
ncbi:hypothetical protein D5018_03330 [Parashewanella curva]|uniref:Uncharacterized protein n=1 Tax=Parashewanella curva TaxID=2338552 RepID=A0A3L8Q0J7_9GAMM|nr:hypothetical protein [Parashewanella curva]RLV61141.1 hypothetical protein D5018_03330 [Parashewanella curva]